MLGSSDDYQRLHMYRFVCDLDSVRDQAHGEPQRVAGAARLLGIKFLDHLVLGSADCEDGRGFVSIVDYLE